MIVTLLPPTQTYVQAPERIIRATQEPWRWPSTFFNLPESVIGWNDLWNYDDTDTDYLSIAVPFYSPEFTGFSAAKTGRPLFVRGGAGALGTLVPPPLDNQTSLLGSAGDRPFYFYKDIYLSEARVTSAKITYIRDDGFVAWFNGKQVLSANMPGSFTHNTFASSAIGVPDEAAKQGPTAIANPHLYFNCGKNRIAFMIFDTSGSSDAGGAMKLDILQDKPVTVDSWASPAQYPTHYFQRPEVVAY